MDKQNIQEKIGEILEKVLGNNSSSNESDMDFSKDIDSIKFVTIILEIENEFNIEIDDDDFDMDNFTSADKLVDLVLSYKETFPHLN